MILNTFLDTCTCTVKDVNMKYHNSSNLLTATPGRLVLSFCTERGQLFLPVKATTRGRQLFQIFFTRGLVL